MTDTRYDLGAYRLAPWRQLHVDNRPVAVGGKALDLLSVLARAEGNMVTKDELMAAVWPGIIVEENAIQVHISAARKALGPEARRLVTVHGRGYRLETDHGGPEQETAGPTRMPSVAVAPFAHITDDPGARAFANGLAEDIATALARIRSITVKAIAAELQDASSSTSHVQYLLQGSVDTQGDRVCIRLKLIETEDGAQVWGEKYDHQIDDRFALQDEVALRVAAAVEPAIEVRQARRIARSRADLMSSYDLYMQGWARVFSYTQDDLLAGIALMDQAIALAPDFGLALAGAGISHHDVYVFGWGADPETHRQRAMVLLERALRIGDDDATILAWVACSLPVLSGNIGRAEALVERALHANPSSANAWFVSGYIRMCRGRFAEARTDYDTSERLAPYGLLSSHARLMVGACHGAQGDFAAAIETIEAASHPGPWPHIYLAGYFAEAGRIEDAQAALASLRAMAVRSLPEIAALFPLAAQPVFPRSALDLIERENE